MLSRQDGAPYLHLRTPSSAPARTNSATRDTLNAAVISATCELVVDLIEGEVGRRFAEYIGLNLLSSE